MSAQVPSGGNFNWIAPVYDALAFLVFGHKLQQAQRVNLNRVPAQASVLLVGGGTGWLLEQLLANCHTQRIVYLETSSEMIRRANQRIVRKALPGTVEFRVGDETSLADNERFDVIITPFVLDLFTEKTLRSHFIPHLLRVLKPTGSWLVTDFVNPPVWWQKALLWVMIHFFRWTAGIETKQLANWQQCLLDANLLLRKRDCQVGGMVSAEVYTAENA